SNIVSMISQYNTLVMERERLLETTSEKNPIIKDRTQALRTMKGTMMASIDSYIATLRLQKDNMRRQQSVATGKIASTPNQAKYLLSVERQQKVKESLYLFLLQKREENELSQAFTAYNTSMIGEPDGLTIPTSPSRTNIMLIAIALGLAIPLAILVLREILDTKIRGKRDLSSLSIPYVGEIPSANKKARGFDRLKKTKASTGPIVVDAASRNSINEAFRVLRTNLEYIGVTDKSTPDGHSLAKIIAVTSSNPGSGKTFISINLAKVLAIKGMRVMVLDLDIRKASLSKITGNNETGITDFIIGRAQEDAIIKKGFDNTPGLDVIVVGALPPNPSELLSSRKLDELIGELRTKYDYIIIDCPPVEIVSDAKIINRLADMTLFVVRAGLLEKDELPNIQEYYDQNRYRNMAILLNGT
ncbi:MAG: polysaccharide biosynthesis tyrosine autokinase, partial [Muribaculaceae bacterium]|nr:polysaccharide biosynthesis tyrosine autokinase [Muribaculaceae bacterium]